MIISHKYKFIFIKVRKTGSSSLEALLAQHCATDDIITPMPSSPEHKLSRNWERAVSSWRLPYRIPELVFWQDTIQKYNGLSQRQQILRGNYYNHIRACDVKACIPNKIWNSYYKFCCDRNPWDKILSRYVWQYHGAGKHLDPKLPNEVTAELFTDYINRGIKSSPSISDYPFYSNRQGRVIVGKIIRFENLASEFAEVCRQLGILGIGAFKTNASIVSIKDASPKESNKTNSSAKQNSKLENSVVPEHRLTIKLKSSGKNFSYQDIYNDEQRGLVAQACSKEIDLLSYEF